MHLAQTVDVLKSQFSVIKKVQLKYSEQVCLFEVSSFITSLVKYLCFCTYPKSPFEVDLVLDLVQDGIRLLFDPKLQRLKVQSHMPIYNKLNIYIYIY